MNYEETKEMLDKEIKDELQKISSMSLGDEKRSKAVDDLTKLYRLKIEEHKWDLDVCEDELKHKQLDEQVKDRYFKVGIAAAEIVLPLIFYGIWMRRGFKFEETGTYTSGTFRNLFNRFKPTKK